MRMSPRVIEAAVVVRHGSSALQPVELQRGAGDQRTPAPHGARSAEPDERSERWPRIVAAYKGYDGYQRNTDGEIPVVICEDRPS